MVYKSQVSLVPEVGVVGDAGVVGELETTEVDSRHQRQLRDDYGDV